MAKGDRTQGIRVADGTSPGVLRPCEYVLRNGAWFGRLPNGDLVNLSLWESCRIDVNGLLTVTPSISCHGMNEWHGVLTGGVWIES